LINTLGFDANEYSVAINIIPELFFPTALFWFTVSVYFLVSISNLNPLYKDPSSVSPADNWTATVANTSEDRFSKVAVR
jgi:hypothetical protein